MKRALTGRITICELGIECPSFFLASAETANNAIDEAVSNPEDYRLSAFGYMISLKDAPRPKSTPTGYI